MQRIAQERPREGTAYHSLECLPQIELIVQSLIFSSFVSKIPKISRLKFLTRDLAQLFLSLPPIPHEFQIIILLIKRNNNHTLNKN